MPEGRSVGEMSWEGVRKRTSLGSAISPRRSSRKHSRSSASGGADTGEAARERGSNRPRIGGTPWGSCPGSPPCTAPATGRPRRGRVSALATRAVPREGRTVPATERLPGAVVERAPRGRQRREREWRWPSCWMSEGHATRSSRRDAHLQPPPLRSASGAFLSRTTAE